MKHVNQSPVFDKTEGQRPVVFGEFMEAIEGSVIESALKGEAFTAMVEIDGVSTSFTLPLRRVPLSKMKPSPVLAKILEEVKEGTQLSLPASTARAMHLVEGLQSPKGRDLYQYYTDALANLWDEAGEIVGNYALRASHPGIQAQADQCLRNQLNEISISVEMAQALSRETGISFMEIVNRGLKMPAERFPVAGPQGVRWYVLRVQPKLKGKKLGFHPLALKMFHQADIDGDLAYTAWIKGQLEFALPEDQCFLPMQDLPDLEFSQDGPDLRELVATVNGETDEDTLRIRKAMSQVLNAKVKDLTGRLTWMFWALARGYAQACKAKKMVTMAAYQRAFSIYEPLIEAVMDARKVEEFTVEALEAATVRTNQLALAIQNMMAGASLDSTVAPGVTVGQAISGKGQFLTMDQLKQLQVMYRESGNLGRARATVGGRLITGQKNLGFSTRKVVEALGEHGCPDGQLWSRIQSCIRMDSTWSMPAPKPKKQEKVEPRLVYPGGAVVGSWVEALESIEWRGQKVFINVYETEVDGIPAVCFDMWPIWRKDQENATHYRRLHMLLPEVEPVGRYGHCLLHMAGEGTSRFFRPQLSKSPRGARFLNVYDSFRLMLKNELLAWAAEGRVSFKAVIQQGMNRAMLMWLHEQQSVRGEIDPMLKVEFTTYIPKPDGREVTEIWDEVHALLGDLLENPEGINERSGFPEGTRFDPLATSKGSPFDVIALAGNKSKRAIYGPYLNPFYRWLDPKRRTEVRELREAPMLRTPKLPSVQLPPIVKPDGTVVPQGLPAPYHGRVTEAWVVLADSNFTVFSDQQGKKWTFDSLAATYKAKELFAIEEEQFQAADEDALGNILARLHRLGVTDDRITVEEEQQLAGYLGTVGAVYRTSYLIRVQGDGEDEGKVKSLISAMKGVLTELPCRLVAVLPWGEWKEIHINWSAMSARKKRLADAASNMVAGREDQDGNVLLPEISPDWSTQDFLAVIEPLLEAAGYPTDGKLEILAIYPDGREVSLGRHFCGPLPMFRGPQTELHSANWRLGGDGVPFEPHGMMIGNIPHPTGKDAEKIAAEFADILRVIRANELERARWAPAQPEDNTDYGIDYGPA